MTEEQKSISVVLEVLAASHPIPRTRDWIATELRLAGRKTDAAALADDMECRGLIVSEPDGLGVRRYNITAAGLRALESQTP